jgi:hypothetical protein
MGFSAEDKTQMLALKGVGNTVITRLEQLGFSKLEQFRGKTASDITKNVSEMLDATCWHNSPQARAAIQAVIALAEKQSLGVRH